MKPTLLLVFGLLASTFILGSQALPLSATHGPSVSHAERTAAVLASLSLTNLAKRAARDDPTPPTLVPSWTSPVTIEQKFYFPNKNVTETYSGTINFLENVGATLQIQQTWSFAPPGIAGIILEDVFNADGTQLIINDQCRRVSDKNSAGNWFSWLPYSTYLGQSACLPSGSSSSLQCTWWQLDAGNVTLQLAVNNQLPYHWVIIEHLAPNVNSNIGYLFSAPTAQSFPSSMFASVPDCSLSYAPPCPYTPLRPVIEMVRFHEANDTNLAQQNTGDVAGDTSFLCGSLLSGTFSVLQQVSMYEVQVNFTFGSYAFCNFEVCLGGDPVLVGREAAMGLGYPRAGQCTPNPYGTWYSLPAKGECRGGESVDAGQCSWKVVRVVKTISSECLMAQGFLEACQKDVVMPFPRAQAVLLNALATSNQGQGGCPAV